jgi:ferric-dicitrate binding protein FerR (iron transport regulator)
MKTPEINSIDDLVANESFRKWIVEKDENEGLVWNQWIEEHPSRIEWVATAKVMIAMLSDETRTLSDGEVDAEAARIQQRIREAGLADPTEEDALAFEEDGFAEGSGMRRKSRAGRLIRVRVVWAVAASLLVVVASAVLFKKNAGPLSSGNAYESFLQDTKNKNIEYNNGTDTVQRILLSDGSEVLLEKNSQLSYAVDFSSGKREVYLNGNAFFTIARDPTRPFIVYTQRIVTRVLGTSFRVIARANEKTASVIVRTGKVSVFSRENFTPSDFSSGPGASTVSGALKGIVLTPNQEMIYDIAKEQMSKTLAEVPVVTKDSISDFVFDDTPATEVFKKLQEAYGITILLDEEVMTSCSISASLGNEPFYEKLNMICRIINASYQVIDGNVVINAKGCRGEGRGR